MRIWEQQPQNYRNNYLERKIIGPLRRQNLKEVKINWQRKTKVIVSRKIEKNQIVIYVR